MNLPDWVPAEAWAGYVEMRKKLKKPMTDRAMALRIADLEQFRTAGHDIAAILDQSTANNWTDLYELKERRATGGDRRALPQLGKHGNATAEQARQWLEQAGMDDSLEQKRRFANLLTHLADYYKSEISRAVLGIYWEGLKQYSYEAIEKACWAHTQSPDEAGRWMPRNSDIIKLMEGSTLDQALVAWSKVERAVRTIGQNQSVAFDDATIQRVIYDMGGWVKLCSCPAVEEFVFVGKEFQTRYRGMVIRSDRPEFPPYLTGFSEDQNSLEYRGQPIQVRAIGDVRQCWQVLKSGTLGGEALDNVQLLAPKAEIARIAGKSPLQLENSI